MTNWRTSYLPTDVGWHNWSGMFTDAALWRPVIRRICHETGIAAAERVELGYPGTCAVFVVDKQVVVKVFPPMFPHDSYREVEVYRLLAGRLDHLPRLLADGIYHDQIDWPYLALQFCPGQPIRELYQILKPEDKLSLAHELGQMLRIAHDTPLTNLVSCQPYFDGYLSEKFTNQFSLDGTLVTFDTRPEAWRQHIAERRNLCLDELRRQGVLPENVLAEAALLLTSVAPHISANSSLNLLHADLTEDHLLLVEQDNGWKISALIDWSDAQVGTPAYEWVVLWFGVCNRDPAMFREVLHTYDRALRFDDAFRRHMMAYTFLHRFGAGIIADALRRDGHPPIYTLTELQDWLWPGLFT